MSGKVMAAVQRSDVPSCAPAAEYVATPEGSLSAAPVMRPVPSDEKKRRTKFFLRGRGCVSDVVAKFVMRYQFVAKPAYNRDRGPVLVFGVRFHVVIQGRARVLQTRPAVAV